MFNAFNHPNFALPSSVEAGVPGDSIPSKFGTLESTICRPQGFWALVWVGTARRA